MSFGGVYVAATRQHVGKTSSSLGLVAGLQRIFTGKAWRARSGRGARCDPLHGRIADDSSSSSPRARATAVGSILGLNNATLATRWTCPCLVVNARVGSAFDEFALNHALIDRTGGALAGVLVNKVAPDKIDTAGGLVLTGRPHERYPDGMDPEIAEFVLSAASYPIFLSREA
ncbi:hypothetical protein JL720_13027 [Aureococcus anophagefferens]|nr:hypothetical protein JL720_13027 [Aureococcus anophagefferens]